MHAIMPGKVACNDARHGGINNDKVAHHQYVPDTNNACNDARHGGINNDKVAHHQYVPDTNNMYLYIM